MNTLVYAAVYWSTEFRQLFLLNWNKEYKQMEKKFLNRL